MNRRKFLYFAALATASFAEKAKMPGYPSASRLRPCTIKVQNGRFHYGLSAGSNPALDNVQAGIDVNDRTFWSSKASRMTWDGPRSGNLLPGEAGRLELHFQDPNLIWTIQFRVANDGQSGTIDSNIRNMSGEPVKLGRCRLADVSDSIGRIDVGSGAENCVWLVMSGWQAPSRVRKVSTSRPRQSSKIFTQLYNPGSGASIHLGFLTFDRIDTEHEVWLKNNNEIVCSSSCDFKGYMLSPGASVESEQLLLQINTDPNDGLSRWADFVQAHYRPRIWKKTPGGWLGSSWVDPLSMERYEDIVRRNSQAVRKRLTGFDIDYIWVSIGNLQDLLPGNWLNWNRKLFPSGPQALIEYLHNLNFLLGLWIGAFWVEAQLTGEIEQLHGAFLRQEGNLLVIKNPVWDWLNYALDPTHPKTKAFLSHVFETYRQCGVRYYMLDFLDAISGMTLGPIRSGSVQDLLYSPDGYYNTKLIPGPQAFREGLRAIREASGPDTYLLASTGPTLQCIGLVDAVRVGSDHGEGRPLQSGDAAGLYPGTFAINDPNFWNSDLQATNALASHSFMHRKLFLVDSGNVMTIDKPVPVPDAQRSATLFGINGGPIMLGDDMSRMSEDRLEMVKKVFPRLPECARAIDLFETPEPDYPKIFHLPIRTNWDDWELIAVFNYGNIPLRRNILLERIQVDPLQPQVVWNFWDERYLGVFSGAVPVDVADGAVTLVRIARSRNHPWVLSTDMHVRQGQAEIESAHWDSDSLTLTVRATRPDGYQGNLFLRVPKGFAFQDPRDLFLAKDENDGSLIVRCPLNFNDGTIFQRSFVKY